MSAASDPGGEWVVHRQLGTGEVLKHSGRQLTVRFAQGVRIIDGKFRKVAPDSLEVRAHQDQNELLSFLENEPLEVARLVLRDRSGPLREADFRSALRSASIADDAIDTWWQDVVATAGQAPWMVVKGDPPTFTVADVAVATSPSAQKGDVPTGAVPAERLIDQIEEETDLARLAAWAFDEPSLEAARAAAKRIEAIFPPGVVAELVEGRIQPSIDGLLSQPSDEAVGVLAGTLNRVRPLLASGAAPSTLRLLLLIERDLERVEPIDVSKGRSALTRIWQAAKPDPAAFVQAVQPLEDEQLVGLLARLPIVPDGPRVALLDALAEAGRSQPLADERTWRGLSAASLGSIVGRPAARALLGTPGGRDLAVSLIGRVLSPLRTSGLATLVASPELMGLFEDARLRTALEGLARADSGIGRMVDLLVVGAMEAVETQIEAERSKARSEVEEAHARAQAAERDGAARVAEAEKAAFHAREVLRGASSDAAAPLGAELRQVRIDGLRGAAEMLADIVRRTGADVLTTVQGAADRLGLASFGAPGETVRFEGSRHSLLGGDPSPQVVVVEPGWEATLDGEQLVLVQALVRQAR